MTNKSYLSGAKEICDYIHEDRRKITALKLQKGLPVFRTSDGRKAIWKALVADLDEWILKQRNKHLI
jgi:hypothetical protein